MSPQRNNRRCRTSVQVPLGSSMIGVPFVVTSVARAPESSLSASERHRVLVVELRRTATASTPCGGRRPSGGRQQIEEVDLLRQDAAGARPGDAAASCRRRCGGALGEGRRPSRSSRSRPRGSLDERAGCRARSRGSSRAGLRPRRSNASTIAGLGGVELTVFAEDIARLCCRGAAWCRWSGRQIETASTSARETNRVLVVRRRAVAIGERHARRSCRRPTTRLPFSGETRTPTA